MSVDLAVKKRDEFGKYYRKILQNENMIPIVLYGAGDVAMHFKVSQSEFLKALPRIRVEKVVILKSEDEAFSAIVQSVQYDPVSDNAIHIDFLLINEQKKIRTKVPVEVVNQNQCLVLRSGGFLNLVKRKIEIECYLKDLPKSLKIDVKDAVIGMSIRISDFVFPDNVECMWDPYTTVITIAGKKASKTKDVIDSPSNANEGEKKAKAPASKPEKKSSEKK